MANRGLGAVQANTVFTYLQYEADPCKYSLYTGVSQPFFLRPNTVTTTHMKYVNGHIAKEGPFFGD